MNLINYVGLRVKIILTNDYYFIGIVKNADEDSLDLLDIKGNQVSLKKESILTIQEVSSNGSY